MLREGLDGWRIEEPTRTPRRRAVDAIVLDDLEIVPVVAPEDEDVGSWFEDDDEEGCDLWVCREVVGGSIVLARFAGDRPRLLSRAWRGAIGGRS
jgi:hypothetical protein